MGRHVDQHVQTPCGDLPARPLRREPDEKKDEEKDDEAMRDVVQVMHIGWDR